MLIGLLLLNIMEIQKTRLWIKETSNDKVHRFTAKKKKKKTKKKKVLECPAEIT